METPAFSGYRRARRTISVMFLAGLVACAYSGTGPRPASAPAHPVDVSASYILAGDANGCGLQLINSATGASTLISNQNTASYGASISPDGSKVAYKAFDASGSQSAVIYDVASGKATVLATGALTGTPAFSAQGHVAYTVGNTLIVKSTSGQQSTADLGHHVNLVSVSPDGTSVCFNDESDQLITVNLKSGKKNQLTSGGATYFAPSFSPNGKSILARTITGNVVTINAKSGKVKNLGAGDAPGWLDSDTVGLTRRTIVEGVGVNSASLVAISASGKEKSVIATAQADAVAAVDAGNFAWCQATPGQAATKDGAASSAVISHGLYARGRALTASVSASLATTGKDESAQSRDLVNGSTTMQLSNVPYIHQNNDTPDWWNGNWSCNATAAIMAIQYYNILPKHPMTSSWPTPHNSDYGWYIPNTYTKGRTFNIGSADPNGTTGYGGYGYITQNGWEDTKGHMAEFIEYHGPTSAVDWSPTMAKARTEIDGNKPFVVLTSITTSGHYPLCIGYVKNQNTLIFNDPYGNKNTGSYPSPDGRNVRYDWPGYNNGYMNLNTVHCYIWCRFVQPSAPSALTATAVSSSKINLTWSDNSSCESNYEILRSTTSGGPYTQIASVGENVESYSNTGLAANTTYYYVVRASNPSGNSANSNQASAKTQAGGATTITVDNNSANFTASANWSTGTSAADKYGTDYRFRNTAAVSDAASWDFNVTVAGNYSIQAWWSQGANRSATAPFILPDGTTVNKNQQTGGGAWQVLGTKALSTGTNTVRLSCWTTTGFVVMADAVRIVPQ